MACAHHLGVLGGRDLAGGQAAIRVAEQVGLPGARLAWIVGGERGEHDEDSLNMGTGREVVRALCRFPIGCRRCRLACRARR